MLACFAINGSTSTVTDIWLKKKKEVNTESALVREAQQSVNLKQGRIKVDCTRWFLEGNQL